MIRPNSDSRTLKYLLCPKTTSEFPEESRLGEGTSGRSVDGSGLECIGYEPMESV